MEKSTIKLRKYLDMLSDEEFDRFMYAFYQSGVLDAQSGYTDKPDGCMSSHMSRHDADWVCGVLEDYTGIAVKKDFINKLAEARARVR